MTFDLRLYFLACFYARSLIKTDEAMLTTLPQGNHFSKIDNHFTFPSTEIDNTEPNLRTSIIDQNVIRALYSLKNPYSEVFPQDTVNKYPSPTKEHNKFRRGRTGKRPKKNKIQIPVSVIYTCMFTDINVGA